MTFSRHSIPGCHRSERPPRWFHTIPCGYSNVEKLRFFAMSGNQPPINLVSDEEIPPHDDSDGLSDADFEDVGSSHATEDPYADIYAAETAEKAPHVEQSAANAPSQSASAHRLSIGRACRAVRRMKGMRRLGMVSSG